MDSITIKSKIITGVLSKVIQHLFRKNKIDIDLDIKSIEIRNNDGRINFDMSGSIAEGDIQKLLKLL